MATNRHSAAIGKANRDIIIAAHQAGHRTASAIAAVTGLGTACIYTHLGQLARDGAIDRAPPPGPPPPSKYRKKPGLALTGSDLRERIRRIITDQRVTEVDVIAGIVCRERKTITHHIRMLERAGKISPILRPYEPTARAIAAAARRKARKLSGTLCDGPNRRGFFASSFGRPLDITPRPRVQESGRTRQMIEDPQEI